MESVVQEQPQKYIIQYKFRVRSCGVDNGTFFVTLICFSAFHQANTVKF